MLNQTINWTNTKSYFLLNKKQDISVQLKNKIISKHKLSSHIFIASSGTLSLGEVKIIALSKKALLNSATSVNQHLKITKQDKILSVLPSCHISDLAAKARAYQAKAFFISQEHSKECLQKWSSEYFIKLLKTHKISMTSLVPTQVFDLVTKQLRPPKHLRCVLVGGSALSPVLCQQALQLSWPLVPTYGMTELCSQIATASLNDLKKIQTLFVKNKNTNTKVIKDCLKTYSSAWKVLPHVQVKIKNNYLCLQSKSLLSAKLIVKKNKIIKIQIYNQADYFLSKDKAFLKDNKITFKAKTKDRINIKSKLVFLPRLQSLLEDINCKKKLHLSDVHLVLKKQDREGFSLVLISDLTHISSNKISKLLKTFNKIVQSHEQIKRVYYLPVVPKTQLNKLKIHSINKLL